MEYVYINTYIHTVHIGTWIHLWADKEEYVFMYLAIYIVPLNSQNSIKLEDNDFGQRDI